MDVWLRPGIADPEGATIERALPALGFDDVGNLRAGRSFRFEVEAPDEPHAQARAEELAHRLLANPVIEDANVVVVGEVDDEAPVASGGPRAPGVSGAPGASGRQDPGR